MEMLQVQTDLDMKKQDQVGKQQSELEKQKAKNVPSEQNGARPANQQKDKKKAPTQGSARSLPEQTPDAHLLEILAELHSRAGAIEQAHLWDRALYVSTVMGATRSRLRRMVKQTFADVTNEELSDWLDYHTIDLGNEAAELAARGDTEGLHELAGRYTQKAIGAFTEEVAT